MVSIYGLHTVQALLRFAPERVLTIYATENRDNKRLRELLSLAQQHSIVVQFVSQQRLDDIQPGKVHQGVAAEVKPADALDETHLLNIIDTVDCPLLLILDGVQDPHNLGACIRTAEAAGVHAVIAPRDKAVGLSSTVRKVACGAAEIVPFVQVVNLSRTIKKIKDRGVWVIGASGEVGESLYHTQLAQAVALVMGAEGSGLRRLTAKHCDSLVSIPMLGHIESLNVSVATGVFLYEAVRQRLQTD